MSVPLYELAWEWLLLVDTLPVAGVFDYLVSLYNDGPEEWCRGRKRGNFPTTPASGEKREAPEQVDIRLAFPRVCTHVSWCRLPVLVRVKNA